VREERSRSAPRIALTASAHYPSLANARVYITGGATGIGAAIVCAFAAQGALVVLCDIDAGCADKLSREVNGAADCQVIDVRNIPALEQGISDAAMRLGGLDVLINNVADDTRHDIASLTADSWRESLAVNLDSAFFASRQAFRFLQVNGGAIVNLGSINAIRPAAQLTAYATAKAGLLGMTRSLAREYGHRGVRVNALLPGWVATQRQLATHLTAAAEAQHSAEKALPGRILPHHIAEAALFLASDAANQITGQELIVDGGFL